MDLPHVEDGMDKLGKVSKALSLFTTLGLTMAASVWVGYLAGHFLDGKFGSYPWLTLFLSLSGIGAGFKGVFRILKEDGARKDP